MKRLVQVLLVTIALYLSATAMAGEIGYVEDFALAPDRAAALKQLIPGTEDYYYYHCLHYQNTGESDKVEAMLKLWIERYNRTPRVLEIENRQALLLYAKQPQKTLDFLIWRLNLQYNHQQVIAGAKADLPSALDANLISTQKLLQDALGRYPQTTAGLEDLGLELLSGMDLGGDRRRDLLNRLARPDFPNLVKLVDNDLSYQYSGGFGSLKIHGLLTLVQLDELLKLRPGLLNEQNFVWAYVTKLRPSPDVDLRHDTKGRTAFLDRLWGFVSTLGPAYNSLKAHVLYQRLTLDRTLGVWDKDRFLTYIKLPRPCPYVPREYLERRENRDVQVDVNASYEQYTTLPIIGSDEPLVRSYLLHFFVEAENYDDLKPLIVDSYLKQVFAEAKITAGVGDPEKWYSMLGGEAYQALKDRVDIDFAFTNKPQYGADEAVTLEIHLKNVKNLIVKVYEINTVNYYRTRTDPIGTDIDLDGLVAGIAKSYDYNKTPFLRHSENFDFPALKKRGVYIVEFIGNGKSSRALVQKGNLHYLVRNGVAGQVFTILNEANKNIADASLFLAGHEYAPEKNGSIVVPYSNNPNASQPIVIRQGDFSTLAHFAQQAETYNLSAGFFVDRESLLKRRTATVTIRPLLTVAGEPASLKVLEEVTLVVSSTDIENVSTTKEFSNFKLEDDREATCQFQVPDNTVQVSFLLKAKVQSLSQNKKIDASTGRSFDFNGIDRSLRVEDLFLSHAGGKYWLDILGKTGESKADRSVNLTIKHRLFKEPVRISLRSNADGRIQLGELAGIEWVSADNQKGTTRQWFLPRDNRSYPSTINGVAGGALCIPYMGKAAKASPAEFSLLEVNDAGSFVADRTAALKLDGAFVMIQDLPAGNYDLLLKETGQHILIQLTKGENAEGYVLGPYRKLQVKNPARLQIASVAAGKDNVTIKLVNADKDTRVIVTADKFLPEFSLYGSLAFDGLDNPGSSLVWPRQSFYISGRNIGDEYRYILDRKFAKKFVGNMLTRPGLLLNPWAIRKTETAAEQLRQDEQLRREAETNAPAGGPASRLRGIGAAGGKLDKTGAAEGSNLDFLSQQSAVMINLAPDKDGVVTIKRADLGNHAEIHVLAVDYYSTVYREMALEEPQMKFVDLRLDKAALDPEKHFTEQKRISVLATGQKLEIADIGSAKFQPYDSLAGLYSLMITLSNNNPTLAEFSFVLTWPKLSDEQKRAKYSEYACHELNFFLYKKDPKFFEQVVQPYLKNKKDKTFMDRFLTGEDLSVYTQPWEHSRLNTVERVLLAQRLAGEQARTARHVSDLHDLMPPDLERFNFLYKTALRGSSLDTGDAFGLGAHLKNLQDVKELQKQNGRAAADYAQPGEGGAAPPETKASEGALSLDPRSAMKEKAQRHRDQAAKKGDAKDLDGLTDDLVTEERGESAKAELDLRNRQATRQLYRKLDKTQEWVENNYYHLPIEQQLADLVTANAFWRDYAKADPKASFLSTELAWASRNFTEIMFTLSVLDLPFEPAKHNSEFKDASFTFTAGSPLIVYHKEIMPAKQVAPQADILVKQNYFRADDRYRYEGNEKFDKYVTDEFLVSTVYGCQIVVTNPTSAKRKLNLLLQVPKGAMPVSGGLYTRDVLIDLGPFSTTTMEYYFYFPLTGQFPHYGVQVADPKETLVGFAPSATLKVVEQLSKVDRTSWEYLSQNGTSDEVLAFLKENNIDRLDLGLIAWRVKDRAFYEAVLALLKDRHVYNQTLWSYSLKHADTPSAREFLKHCDDFVAQCGLYLDSPLLTIDPVVRLWYQHMEYAPLVNARAHKVGKDRTILNDRFSEQYQRLMRLLCYHPQLTPDDNMAVTYYMLLQDRIEEGMTFLTKVDPVKLPTRLQYDYFTAYVGFYREDIKAARKIAQGYEKYPVDRWQKLFANVLAQSDEVEGKAGKVVDDKDHMQTQSQLAATEASVDLKVEGGKIVISYQNIKQSARVNYYLMDVELLFSRNPFVSQYSGQFSFVRPNDSAEVKLSERKNIYEMDLPKSFRSSNVMIEVVADGVRKSQAYYANSLAVQMIENYGQVKVMRLSDNSPLAKVYVKAYARMKDGSVKFYKDGYTDLRGRFDYASLNTNELENVEKFSILVLSETDGAVVKEANPPKQ